MKYKLKKNVTKPFLFSKDNIITEVNDGFEYLTGYFKEELTGKSLDEISNMLKIDSQVSLENVEIKCVCYIFTKEYEPIEVEISCIPSEGENEKIYFFKKNLNLDVEEKFSFAEQLYPEKNTGISIFSLPDLILLKANDSYLSSQAVLYNKKENCLGRKMKEIAANYIESDTEKIWNEIVSSGTSYHTYEQKLVYPGRADTYWNTSVVPIYKKGKVKYIIQSTLDVTEKVLNRKYIEEQARIIKEQKDELEAIIENMSDGLYIIDKDLNVKLLNSSVRELAYEPDSIKTAQDVLKHITYHDSEGNILPIENSPAFRVLRGEKIKEYRVASHRPDGIHHLSSSGSPIYDKNGNIEKAIICIRDVTDRARSEEALLLKTQYDLLNNIIENLEVGFIRYSYPEFKIIDLNNMAYRDIKKYSASAESLQSIKGQTLFDIFGYDGNAEMDKFFKNLTRKEGGSYYINKTYSMDGEEKFYKVIYQSLFGLNNKILEVISIAIDITEEVKAKNKMEETLKIQEQIFANVSHELKTPLNVIFSTNQLMELYLKNDSLEANKEKISKSLNIIRQNCYRFTKLINNIDDLSKIESGFLKVNLSNENIVQITEDIVQSVSEYVKGKGISIVFDTNTEEKIFAFDPCKFERVILNLISNAIKFTNPNGSILVKLIDKDDSVEISVRDTGIGMDKKHLNNIFKRFHQVDKSLSRNAEGSGIGLSLVKSIVKLHGGKISVESIPGEGSVFTIDLPVRKEENVKDTEETQCMDTRIERINIEFSDIYSI